MSADRPTEPPSYLYITPVEGQDEGHVYHIPINPPPPSKESTSIALPVLTKGGDSHDSGLTSGDGKSSSVRQDEKLGRSPGMTTCTFCKMQVMTNVTYIEGKFSRIWLIVFIILGLLMCLVPMLLVPLPLCVKSFKDVQHLCPRCDRVLHIEKKQCCSR